MAIALTWLQIPHLLILWSVRPVSTLALVVVVLVSAAVIVALLLWVRWEERQRGAFLAPGLILEETHRDLGEFSNVPRPTTEPDSLSESDSRVAGGRRQREAHRESGSAAPNQVQESSPAPVTRNDA